MKRFDVISMVLIAVLGIVVAAWVCDALLGNPDEESVTFNTIEEIKSDLGDPDPDTFNVNAINPTVEVYVGTCVDADSDGVLSEAELTACHEIESK